MRVDPPCRALCNSHGLCALHNGQCMALEHSHCAQTPMCRTRGACAAVAGKCQPALDYHCAASTLCATENACFISKKNTCEPRRHDRRLYHGGVAAVSAGPSVLLFGTLFYFFGGILAGTDEGEDPGPGFDIAAGLMMGTGAAATIAGIPMIVIGKPFIRPSDIPLQLDIGPTSAKLTLAF